MYIYIYIYIYRLLFLKLGSSRGRPRTYRIENPDVPQAIYTLYIYIYIYILMCMYMHAYVCIYGHSLFSNGTELFFFVWASRGGLVALGLYFYGHVF